MPEHKSRITGPRLAGDLAVTSSHLLSSRVPGAGCLQESRFALGLRVPGLAQGTLVGQGGA